MVSSSYITHLSSSPTSVGDTAALDLAPMNALIHRKSHLEENMALVHQIEKAERQNLHLEKENDKITNELLTLLEECSELEKLAMGEAKELHILIQKTNFVEEEIKKLRHQLHERRKEQTQQETVSIKKSLKIDLEQETYQRLNIQEKVRDTELECKRLDEELKEKSNATPNKNIMPTSTDSTESSLFGSSVTDAIYNNMLLSSFFDTQEANKRQSKREKLKNKLLSMVEHTTSLYTTEQNPFDKEKDSLLTGVPPLALNAPISDERDIAIIDVVSEQVQDSIVSP